MSNRSIQSVAMLLSFCLSGAALAQTRAYPEAPDWVADQTLYEVNVRHFSETGDFAGLQKQLPRLKAMGVGTLWIMPVHPIGQLNRPGALGSPYAPRDYMALNPDYGTIESFKATIEAAHKLGMHVILDWVPVHTSPDHVWVKEHPQWYKRDAAGNLVPPVPEWKDVAALNYDAPGLRKAMSDAMVYWVKEVGVDGFRVDTAEWVPLDFWCEVRDTLRAIKPVFMLAEGAKPELMEYAFDAAYAWNLPENTQGIVSGAKTVPDLINYLNADTRILPAGAFRLNFTSNHDKNAWEGTTRDQLKESVAAASVLTFTIPGMPLIFNGQETGEEHRLSFFEPDKIKWRDDPMATFYRDLATLKRDHVALHAGRHAAPLQLLELKASPAVLGFVREAKGDKVVVLINFSDKPVMLPVPANASDLKPALAGHATLSGTSLTLAPWGYHVWASQTSK